MFNFIASVDLFCYFFRNTVQDVVRDPLDPIFFMKGETNGQRVLDR